MVPHYNFFIIVLGPLIAAGCWLLLSRTGIGRMIRAAAYDREMLAALGADVGRLYTLMFMAGAFLAGLGGALVTPVRSIVPGMDVDIIVEAFIVVVIGGLGSFWGTFLGALIFGQVLAFGILVLPGFSIFAVFALMAVVLIVRPAGLVRAGRCNEAAHSLGAASSGSRLLCVPWLGSRFYTFLATEIVILALFALSLNLLLGYAGLVSFGHAAYFGIGAYTCAILMKTHGVPFPLAFLAAGAAAAAFALLFGFFCVRSTQDLLRDADARLRADRVGGVLQVERGHRRRAGLQQRALPRPRLDGGAAAARLACAPPTTTSCW